MAGTKGVPADPRGGRLTALAKFLTAAFSKDKDPAAGTRLLCNAWIQSRWGAGTQPAAPYAYYARLHSGTVQSIQSPAHLPLVWYNARHTHAKRVQRGGRLQALEQKRNALEQKQCSQHCFSPQLINFHGPTKVDGNCRQISDMS
jgi:hypothetical protein